MLKFCETLVEMINSDVESVIEEWKLNFKLTDRKEKANMIKGDNRAILK